MKLSKCLSDYFNIWSSHCDLCKYLKKKKRQHSVPRPHGSTFPYSHIKSCVNSSTSTPGALTSTKPLISQFMLCVFVFLEGHADWRPTRTTRTSCEFIDLTPGIIPSLLHSQINQRIYLPLFFFFRVSQVPRAYKDPQVLQEILARG